MYRVRIIVEDEFDFDVDSLEEAKEDAERLAKEIMREHLVSATVESVVQIED